MTVITNVYIITNMFWGMFYGRSFGYQMYKVLTRTASSAPAPSTHLGLLLSRTCKSFVR